MWVANHFEPDSVHESDLGSDTPSRSTDATVRWLRCLANSVALSHDRNTISLWNVERLEPIAWAQADEAGNLHPQNQAPEHRQRYSRCGLRDDWQTTIFASALSPDRRQVAVGTSREVVVLQVDPGSD